MRRITLIASVLLLAACNSRSEGDHVAPDSGTHDGGGGTDLGPLHDAGSGDGATSVDGGDASTHDGGTSTDGGAMPDSGPACMHAIAMLEASDLPRCSTETRDCMDACATADGGMTPACVQDCAYHDDTTAITFGTGVLDCIGCLSYQQRYCSDHSGCHDATAALRCCVALHCPDGSCTMDICATEYEAWMTCTTTTAASCFASATGGDFAACFPAGAP